MGNKFTSTKRRRAASDRAGRSHVIRARLGQGRSRQRWLRRPCEAYSLAETTGPWLSTTRHGRAHPVL